MSDDCVSAHPDDSWKLPSAKGTLDQSTGMYERGRLYLDDTPIAPVMRPTLVR